MVASFCAAGGMWGNAVASHKIVTEDYPFWILVVSFGSTQCTCAGCEICSLVLCFSVPVPLAEPLESVEPFALPVVVIVCLALVDKV